LLESTRTNFVVAAYRFSSEGYLSFGDLPEPAIPRCACTSSA
jgi:outer membrane usher protein